MDLPHGRLAVRQIDRPDAGDQPAHLFVAAGQAQADRLVTEPAGRQPGLVLFRRRGRDQRIGRQGRYLQLYLQRQQQQQPAELRRLSALFARRRAAGVLRAIAEYPDHLQRPEHRFQRRAVDGGRQRLCAARDRAARYLRPFRHPIRGLLSIRRHLHPDGLELPHLRLSGGGARLSGRAAVRTA